MAIIQKGEKGWNVVNNVEGEGSDVNSVDFADLTDNGFDDIVVSWSVISKSQISYIDVYNKSEEGFEYEQNSKPVVADEFICVDANDDGVAELLTFSTGSTTESPFSELYSFAYGDKELIGETKLDNSIMSFEQITVGETEVGTSIYLDALRADGSSMVTEFIYWSDYYGSIVSPLYSYSTGKTADTTRRDLVLSRDIDDDGEVEIPTDADIDTNSDDIKGDNWVAYNNTIFTHKVYSVSCKRDAYLILLTNNEYEKLTFNYDEENRLLSVTKGDEFCYEIKAVLQSEYEDNAEAYSQFTKLSESSGYVYLARFDGESDYNAEYLSGVIKAY